jgi:hypothetical protein
MSKQTDLREACEALARVVAALADNCPVCRERRATHAKAQARFRKAAKARKARVVAALTPVDCSTCKTRRATDAARQRKHRRLAA